MTDSVRHEVQEALGDAYRIDRELGGGGMSRVFVARDVALDRDVVVKVLSGDATAGLSGDRFRREIQTIAKLQHPHIVSIISAGAAAQALYYVMPYVRGETLRARMSRESRLPVPEVVRVLREVLDALAFAHSYGVVHRDIKPENVLLEANHALVADFGIAKALSESGNMTSVGMALGTPSYMAPEQATGDPDTNHRADLYAVGVLAYELLTGTPLFSGTTQQVITAHITTPAPSVRVLRDDVPDALASLIARALEKEPSARPQSAAEMITALDSIATPVGLTARTGVTPRARNRWLVGGVVVVMVIAAAAYARKNGASSTVVASGAELIAVMPLGAVSDTSLTRLGQDLVVTLSANFDGVGALRSIDAATLLMKARNSVSPMPLADAQRLAAELGAGSVMTGTLIGVGDQVKASVVLYRTGTDSVLAKASATAPPRDIAALTDSLSWSVLQQVWRRGDAPSPVLTGITTASFDALRAFLDGERKFQKLEQGALADYRRAFELDTNFAQAYLRFDYVNSWLLASPDSIVHRRLLELKSKLPERERLWVETREHDLPLPATVAEWKELAQRYPDYPPFLMAAADPIIHFGPIYGIPISDARPMLDRLDQLVPDHLDTKMHIGGEIAINGSAGEAGEYLMKYGAATRGSMGKFMVNTGLIFQAAATGSPLPSREQLLEMARVIASEVPGFQALLPATGMVSMFTKALLPQQLAMVQTIQKSGVYTGELATATAFGESILRAGRGDWMGAVNAAQRMESSSLPLAMRISAARIAGLGAWMEAVDVRVADSALRRARSLANANPGTYDETELGWLDGLGGVVDGNESRWRAAVQKLESDTSLVARHAARSLVGLWINRTNPDAAADALQANSDDVMNNGGYLLSAESVSRLVIARSLRQRNQPAAVERYLMWPDALVNSARLWGAAGPMAPLTAYERGSAFDAAGNVSAAIKHYRQFVDNYDQPPAAHQAAVDDAKARLAVLEKSDVPRTKSVPQTPAKRPPQ